MSPLGFEQLNKTINQGDTAEIVSYPFDDDLQNTDPSSITDVAFSVKKPDGTVVPIVGDVQDDGSGFVRITDTAQTGRYQVLSRFVFDSGEIRSNVKEFEVIDPFAEINLTGTDLISEYVWIRLEDCFDSDEGGPYLRDMTLKAFTKDKIPAFIPDALFEISQQPHGSQVTIGQFTTPMPDGTDNPDIGLLVQGTLVSVIRHLMRSYVEQPDLTGTQTGYENRRDYLQRWQTIYQIELERYQRWLALWKRQFLGYSHSALLVANKSGRMYPGVMRSRNIGRGYW